MEWYLNDTVPLITDVTSQFAKRFLSGHLAKRFPPVAPQKGTV
jgi:hypothetical protein